MQRTLKIGITDYDSSNLSEFRLAKNYKFQGIKYLASMFNTKRLDHRYKVPHVENVRFRLHYGDKVDPSILTELHCIICHLAKILAGVAIFKWHLVFNASKLASSSCKLMGLSCLVSTGWHGGIVQDENLRAIYNVSEKH